MTHADVLQRLARSGLLEDSQVLWFPSAEGSLWDSLGEGTLSGRMMVGGHEVRLRVRLPAKFPLCLPDIQVEGIQLHVELPHMLGGAASASRKTRTCWTVMSPTPLLGKRSCTPGSCWAT